MKYIYTYCLLMLMPLLAVGCGPREIDDDMPDSVKLELLDLNLERDPDNAEILAARAKVLFNLQRVKEANFDISRALKADPENFEYLMLKADIAFANGNVEESYRALESAEKLAPKNQEVQLKMGEITFYSRDYDRSLKYLSNVTERDANNRTALFMKGFIYKEKGDTAAAVQLFRRVCDKFPDYAPAFEELGVLYASRSDAMAVEYLSTVLRLEPSNTNAMYALALFYQDRQDIANAEPLYRQILDLNPESADAWHNLGYIALTYHNNYEQAVECFDKALAIAPQMKNAIANRQLALEQIK